MLLRSRTVWWSARYFSRSSPRQRKKYVSHCTGSLSTASSHPRTAPALLSSHSVPPHKNIHAIEAPLSPLGQRATEILFGLHDAINSHQRWGELCFDAKQGLLASLRSALPQPASTASCSLCDKPSRLRVVSDSDMEHFQPSSVRHSLPTDTLKDVPMSAPPALSPLLPAPATEVFLRKELFLFITVYSLVESEDGLLLTQLMKAVSQSLLEGPLSPPTDSQSGGEQQWHKHTRKNKKWVGDASSSTPSWRLEGSVAQFLYLFSDLKVIEEQLVTTALGSPEGRSRSGIEEREKETEGSRDPILQQGLHKKKERGVLYHEIGFYDFPEMLLLGPSLLRFGLQNELAFKLAVKRFRHLQFAASGSSSPLKSFGTYMSSIRQRFDRLSPRDAVDAVNVLLPFLEDAVIHHLPPSLQLEGRSFSLLLEWLDALALSLHRHRGLVQCLSDLLAVNALRLLSLSPTPTSEREEAGMNPLWPVVPPLMLPEAQSPLFSLPLWVCEVLRLAVQRTEEMKLPQPLLAVALQQCRVLSHKGLLVDGGEAAEIPSERLAYYDHITADLIKVNHVSEL